MGLPATVRGAGVVSWSMLERQTFMLVLASRRAGLPGSGWWCTAGR